MTKPVRFNFNSLPAERAIEASMKARGGAYGAKIKAYQRHIIQDRAQALFLHWWAVGHDPARHVLACPECDGDGHLHNGDYDYTCNTCNGFGTVDRTDTPIDTRRNGYYGKY